MSFGAVRVAVWDCRGSQLHERSVRPPRCRWREACSVSAKQKLLRVQRSDAVACHDRHRTALPALDKGARLQQHRDRRGAAVVDRGHVHATLAGGGQDPARRREVVRLHESLVSERRARQQAIELAEVQARTAQRASQLF